MVSMKHVFFEILKHLLRFHESLRTYFLRLYSSLYLFFSQHMCIYIFLRLSSFVNSTESVHLSQLHLKGQVHVLLSEFEDQNELCERRYKVCFHIVHFWRENWYSTWIIKIRFVNLINSGFIICFYNNGRFCKS